MDEKIVHGPTGETCLDLPSPYEAHKSGLLHLPRFIAKIRKHLNGQLPKSYQRNFTKGFDGFLCLHLNLDPAQIINCVKISNSEKELEEELSKIFPSDLKVYEWNRKVVQMGTADMAKEKLEEVRRNLGAQDRMDLISFADIIDFDEGKIF